jgi:hypothetical protein
LACGFALRCRFAELLAILGLVGYYDRLATKVNKAQASPEEICREIKMASKEEANDFKKARPPQQGQSLTGGSAVKPWLSASFSWQQLSSLQALLIPPGSIPLKLQASYSIPIAWVETHTSPRY